MDIDPDNLNTSHGLVIDLVGTGKRVLDVGCSTGQLGRLLIERGNKVSGFEIDPAAAAIAEQHLDEVVVGDLESPSWISPFDAGSFDVIIFADVLEHLRDPSAPLRRAKDLLADGGYVVVSIPNVAHGAVRLALLEGRFDYSELGLLDNTHLRFFTKSTLESLFHSSGYLPTDFRRTTAGVFATELPIDPLAYSQELIEGVSEAPESATYQFVVQAMPVDGTPDGQALASLIVAKDQEIEGLRRHLHAIARSVGPTAGPPVVGLITWPSGTDGESAMGVLRRMTVAAEIRRRLQPGMALRCYTVSDAGRIRASDGEPLTPLLPWNDDQLGRITSEAAAVVLTGPVPGSAVDPSVPTCDQLQRQLTARGCRVLSAGASLTPATTTATWPPGLSQDWAYVIDGEIEPATDGRSGVGPDPLVLVDRLFSPALLDSRIRYLRLVGDVDRERPLVVTCLSSGLEASVPAICRAVKDLIAAQDAQVVFLDSPDLPLSSGSSQECLELIPQSRSLPGPRPPIDLLAIVNAAAWVVTDSAAMLAIALALRTPYMALSRNPDASLANFVHLARDSDLLIDRPDQLAGAVQLASARAADPGQRMRMTNGAELRLDDVAGTLTTALAGELAHTTISGIDALSRRLQEVETANAALQRRMMAERVALGQLASPAPAPSDVAVRVPAPSIAAALVESQAELEQLRTEVAAIHNLKSMRLLKPARDTYGRLRFRNR